MSRTDFTTDGYIFLNLDLPHVAWAAYRGVLITPPKEKTANGRFVSWWQSRLYENSPHFGRENALELVRTQEFPERISRLSCIFCFLDKESATRAARLWNAHFRLENLVEVNLGEARGRQRLDSNWITYSNSEAALNTDKWIQRYWQGEPFPGQKPIWESLVEGRVTLAGNQVLARSYETVKAHWPDSLLFLKISRSGAHLGFNIGSISAFLREGTENCRVEFFMDMKDADNPEFLAKLGSIEAEDLVTWADIERHLANESFGAAPDMRPLGFSFPKDIALQLNN